MISIIMTVYNAAPFLPACLDSILGQSTDDWELCAVINYATDDSFDILSAYARSDKRIKVVQNDGPEGIQSALRKAFSMTSGIWITRMDADDIMDTHKLSALKKALQERGRGYVATGLVHYFSDEGELGNGFRRYEGWLNSLTLKETNFTDIYRECVIPSPCWMVHREDLMKCEAFEPEVYPEDYDLCFRFYKYGLKVAGVDRKIHLWRDYPWRNSRVDERYADQRFLKLKLPYFFELDRDPNRPLLLWGAGHNGKKIAKWLSQHKKPFHWITNNTRKIGQHIYGVLVEPESIIWELDAPQSLIAVSAPEAKEHIKEILYQTGFQKGQDYFLMV